MGSPRLEENRSKGQTFIYGAHGQGMFSKLLGSPVGVMSFANPARIIPHMFEYISFIFMVLINEHNGSLICDGSISIYIYNIFGATGVVLCHGILINLLTADIGGLLTASISFQNDYLVR